MNLNYSIKVSLLKISVCALPFIFVTNSVMAANVDSLFKSDEIIKMELRSDFSAIQKDRAENPEYHDGELIYYSSNGEPTKLSVKVMARGNFRRNPVNCNFPPLYLNFKKNEVKNTIFDNQDKLKLVTPCHFEEDLIDEYVIYKMYNQVTDLSMKVRLVDILYFDTGLNKKVFEKHSFFIEDKKHTAERNNAIAKNRVLMPFDLNKENFEKLSVFQYLIGNKDWFITSRKNIVIMQPKDTSMGLYAVPYDFDFSGFVNAEYTKPKGVPENLLTDRRQYKGLCFTDDEFKEIFAFYRELRPAFDSIINNQKFIPNYDKKQIFRYIDNFYKLTESSELIKQEFLVGCETKKDYNIVDKEGYQRITSR
jgi:hypothetical protein